MAAPGTVSRSAVAAIVVFGLLLPAAAAPAAAAEPLAPPHPPQGACVATAQVEAEWGVGATGGQVVSVLVRNTGIMAGKRWTVSWALAADQRFDSGWNAAFSASGRVVTAAGLDYNGALQPGAVTGFGFLLTGTGPAPQLSCSTDAPTVDTVTVTEADNRRSVNLVGGQVLTVSLGPDYRPITLTGEQLTLASTSGGYPTGRPLVATYRVGAYTGGPTELTTTTDYDCLHISPMPCALPQRLWQIRVYVVTPPPEFEEPPGR